MDFDSSKLSLGKTWLLILDLLKNILLTYKDFYITDLETIHSDNLHVPFHYNAIISIGDIEAVTSVVSDYMLATLI